ncbi:MULTISPECIES: hypothetical protein [Legionella]|uniref:Membrane-associated HD superfamily hydrolase n=1 Tax=Legionella resiliens TaxID=2905958 RepID=A0ABS8X4D7_9GAMM|nr:MULTISPECIES: hypothetical protein [unclassified Legionella]MCE0723685.1 hypothetical protein [Legionella sp. 9fVS26]MCE3532837.1 hypothetical protein [Legionella sp. 8cVS16]QLZ69021.1 hypothetical protein FOLKNPGA_01803 [Legionella sp. PC1000]
MTQSKKDELERKKEEANKELEEDIDRINKEESKKKQDESLEAARFKHQQEWAKVMDELREKHKSISKKTGKESTLWEDVMAEADDVINSEQTSINDWRSNMMSLLNFFSRLNKAMNTSSTQVAGEAVDRIKKATHEIPIVRSITHPKEFIYEGLKSAILHKIKGDKDISVDGFKQKVTFKDGKVDIAPLTDKNGNPLPKQRDQYGRETENEADKAFKKLVDLWLQENDYVMDSQTKIYKHYPDGTPLTQKDFDELHKGLGKFLKETASFKFEEQESLQSGLTHS